MTIRAQNNRQTGNGNIRAFLMDAVTGIAMLGMCAVWCFVIWSFGG